MRDSAEFTVIGAGPAGYVAARRLGQLGREVVLIERENVGGVCLNWGCIPTKSLYAATDPLGRKDAFRDRGIELRAEVDLERLRGWSREVVAALVGGVEKVLAASHVEIVRGTARLAGPGRVLVESEDGTGEIRSGNIVLATGSQPIAIPTIPFDGETVWDSRDALSLPRVPERLAVVGGGVIGLELATVYRRLGSQVVVVEMRDRLLPGVGLSKRGQAALKQALKRQGIEFMLETSAVGLEDSGLSVRQGEEERVLPCDAVLVAVGRRPDPSDLGLETVGIEPERGFVPTDSDFRAAPGVYAIGDLRGGALLAHKAHHEALLLADRLAGGYQGDDRDWVIPQAIFTHPEIGLVGLSEEEAKGAGYRVSVGRFPAGALGRALAEGEPLGYFQVVADSATGRLLGAEIVAPHASDTIAEVALAIQAGLTLEEFAATVHAHPTFPEGLWEAALAALGRPLHVTR
jgi:dihydrolipoamide dehydrogenase